MSFDIKLDDNGDIAIEDGDIVLIDGIERVKQTVVLSLGIIRGEYPYDTDFGIPVISIDAQGRPLSTYLFDDRMTSAQRHAFISQYLLSLDDITSIEMLSVDVDQKQRKLYVYADLVTNVGPLNINQEVRDRHA